MKEMQLELAINEIKEARFGARTAVENGILFVNREELTEYLRDPVFTGVTVDLAAPGDSTRIIPVKDVVEPRIKVDGDGGAFPGFFGQPEG